MAAALTMGGGGAMEITKIIGEAHEGAIVALAYNRIRREIYSAADGDKVIKVRQQAQVSLMSQILIISHAGLGLPVWTAPPFPAGSQGHGHQLALLLLCAYALLRVNR